MRQRDGGNRVAGSEDAASSVHRRAAGASPGDSAAGEHPEPRLTEMDAA